MGGMYRRRVAQSTTLALSLLIGGSISTAVIPPSAGGVSYAESASPSQPPLSQLANRPVSEAEAERDGYFTKSISVLADGSIEHTYNMFGHTIEALDPPPGFSPRAATPSQLAAYGFPPRPTGPALQSWEEAMSAFRSFADPTFTFELTPVTDAVAQAPVYGANWSGYAATATTHNNFVAAEAAWTVPNEWACSGTNGDLSIWTGVGGAQNAPNGLLQSGVGYNLVADPQQWTAWLEYLTPTQNNGPYVLMATTGGAIPVGPGTPVFSSTYYAQSTGYAWYYLENTADGIAGHFGQPGSGSFYDGGSAEVILEESNYFNGGELTGPALGFAQFSVSNAEVENLVNLWYTFPQTAYTDNYIPNPSRNSYLAEPAGLNGATFNEYFGNCT